MVGGGIELGQGGGEGARAGRGRGGGRVVEDHRRSPGRGHEAARCVPPPSRAPGTDRRDARERSVDVSRPPFTRRSCALAGIPRRGPTPPYPPCVVLLGAALSLVPPSATARELGDRFAAAGADLRPGIADALLAELAALGLVRVSRREGDDTRHVIDDPGSPPRGGGRPGRGGPDPAGRPRGPPHGPPVDDLARAADAPHRHPDQRRPAARPRFEPDRGAAASAARGDLAQRRADAAARRRHPGAVAVPLRQHLAPAPPVPCGGARGVHDRAGRPARRPAQPAPRARRRRRPGSRGVRRSSPARTGAPQPRRQRAEVRPDGGTVTIRVEARGEDTAWSVADAGPGISAEDQERLFERFFVGRNDVTGPREGVGLGLPTALAIAQAHDGTIEVDSEPGRGSTFTLVVPTDGPAGGTGTSRDADPRGRRRARRRRVDPSRVRPPVARGRGRGRRDGRGRAGRRRDASIRTSCCWTWACPTSTGSPC